MTTAARPPLPLIPAKLAAPALHPGLLPRPRFDEWLQRLPQVRLAVLQALQPFVETRARQQTGMQGRRRQLGRDQGQRRTCRSVHKPLPLVVVVRVARNLTSSGAEKAARD